MGKRGRRLGWVLLLLSLVDSAVGVCPHCKDTVVGCAFDAANNVACPLVSTVAANAAIFASKSLERTPTLSNLKLPAELTAGFPRPVCDAIVALACAPAQGSHMDLSVLAANGIAYVHSATAVAKAAAYGHCSVAEASAELMSRAEACTSELEVSKLNLCIASLKSIGETTISATQGVLSYVWAKISSIIGSRNNGVQRLNTGTTPKSSALSVTLVRPTLESAYYEMLHYFTMLMIMLGISNPALVLKFLDDVAYGAMRRGERWQVGFELVRLYLRKIDDDSNNILHLGNVYGHQSLGIDSIEAEARQNATAFFRTRAVAVATP